MGKGAHFCLIHNNKGQIIFHALSQDQRIGVVIPLSEIVVTSQKLGEGEIGEAYSALWRTKKVAFKKFRAQSDSEEWRAKMKHEVKSLRQLRHPRVVAVYGVTLEIGSTGIIMERLTCNLHQALFIDKRSLSGDKRKKIIRQILEGLEFLHSKEVVHCNLTSKNVLLDQYNGAKITNYGPKFVRSIFESIHDPIGKFDPNYAAPEILQSKPLTCEQLKEADVYSMAVLSYEVMESVEPYEGLPSQLTRANSTRQSGSSPPSANLSHGMFDVMKRCWDEDSAKRPSSRDFLNDWRRLTMS